MTDYIPRNDIVLVEKLPSESQTQSGIILTTLKNGTKFIRLRVLKVGEAVHDLKHGDIVIAEDTMYIVNNSDENLGVINSKYIHAIEVGN